MLRRSLLLFLLLSIVNNFYCQKFELNERFKELLKETAKNEAVYNYMLFSIELKWKKDNQLITKDEFLSLRTIEMKKLGLCKPIPINIKQNTFNLLASNAAEPFITVNPNDSSILVSTVINNISSPPYNCPIFYSNDAGTTWNQSSFDPLAASLTTITNPNTVYGTSDPVLAIDNNGIVHMVYLTAYEPSGGGFYIGTYYVYSIDGGQSFVTPPANDFVVTSGEAFNGSPLDRIWLATDNSGGPNDGNVYLSGFLFDVSALVGEVVYVKSPLSSGFTQGPFAAITGTAQSGNIIVDNNGTLHLSCSRAIPSGGGGEIIYTRSADQGQTWDNPIVLDTGKHYLLVGETSQIHNSENCAPSLAVGNSNIYLAWSNLDSNNIRSFYAYSQDGGNNWSGTQEFGPVLVPGPYFHLMPCISAFGDKCSISWFVVDSTTLQGEYYLAELINNGQNYGSSESISSGSTDFSTTGETTFYGDYNTIFRDSCLIYTIWADGQVISPTTYIVKSTTCDSAIYMNEYTPLNSGLAIESLYPNPAWDKITVNLTISNETALFIEIIDAQGKSVKNQSLNTLGNKQTITILINDLSSGNYLLKIKQKNGIFISRKFLKK